MWSEDHEESEDAGQINPEDDTLLLGEVHVSFNVHLRRML
jgi:hypothetical protein